MIMNSLIMLNKPVFRSAANHQTKRAIAGHRDERFARFDITQEEACKRLMDLLQALRTMCEKTNTKFWLECGTLLGAFRTQDFMPHDPDADVGMLYTDLIRLKGQKPQNDAFIFEVDSHSKDRIPNKKWQVDARIIDTLSGIYVDIFGFSEIEKTRHAAKWVGFNCLDVRVGSHPGLFYDAGELFPLSECQLHGINFYCPRKTKEHLQKMYGYDLRPPSKTICLRLGENVLARLYYFVFLRRNSGYRLKKIRSQEP